MPLETRLVDFPFVGGIDEHSDAFLLQPPRLRYLNNGRLNKAGAIEKRPGHDEFSMSILTGAAISDVWQMAGSLGELIECGVDKVRSHVAALGRWAERDRAPRANAKRSMTMVSPQIAQMPSVVYGSGLRVLVWLQNRAAGTVARGDIWAMVVDDVDGAVVRAPEVLVTGQTSMNPKLVVVGTTAIMVYATNAGALRGRTLNLAAPNSGWGADTLLKNDAIVSAANVPYDISAIDGGADFVMVYESTAAAPNIVVTRIGTSLTVAATATCAEATAATKDAFAIAASASGSLWIAVSYTSGGTQFTRCELRNPSTLAAVTAPFTVYSSATAGEKPDQIGILLVAAARAQVIAQRVDAGGVWTQLVDSNATLTGSRRFTPTGPVGTLLASKPWLYASRGYVLLYGYSNIQGVYYVVDTSCEETSATAFPLRPVCTLGPGLANSAAGLLRGASALPAFGQKVHETIAPMLMSQSADVNGRVGIAEARIDHLAYRKRRVVELGNLFYISGGVPCYFDGQVCGEIGFLAYPENITHAESIVGSGMTPGTRQYLVCYAIQDRKGNWHYSAPSPAVTVVTANGGATNRCTLTIPNLPLTLRQDLENSFTPEVHIVVFRTEASGSIFYRISPDEVASGLRNNPNTATTTYADDALDSAVNTNPVIYTTGPSGRRPLERTVPPALHAMVAHKRRLFAVADDGAIWWSSEVQPSEAVWFNDSQQFLPEYDVVALGSLDTALVIFGRKENEVSLLYGEGPDRTGGQSDYQVPVRIPSPVGCRDERSVVTMPLGVMFQGHDGDIYLLDRQSQVRRIGQPIEDTIRTYPVITSATLIATQGIVVFHAMAAEGDLLDGITYVYDYEADVWIFDRYQDNVGDTVAVVTGVVHNGIYKWATSYGLHLAQSSSTHRDFGSWVTLDLRSGELQPAGMQGYARLRRVLVLAKSETAHGLSLYLFRDKQSAAVESKTWTDSQITAMADTRTQPERHVANQKGESFSVRLHDAAPSVGAMGSGKGPNFKGLTFEVGVKKGAFKQPAAARA